MKSSLPPPVRSVAAPSAPGAPPPAGPGPTERTPLVSGRPRTDAEPPGGSAPQRRSRVIGVMGGMGPAAANDFGRKLVELNSGARSDQDHARVLLDQATDVADRTAAILAGTRQPVAAMEASLKRLDRGGADLVAITCNTAHHFFDDMQAAIDRFGLKLELLHIVDATMEAMAREAPGARRIGLLATSGTLQTQIYQNRAQALGQEIEWLTPQPDTQAARVMAGIYEGVKAGDLEGGRRRLLEAARELQGAGAQAILLACTEIPLVLKTGDVTDDRGRALPLIDTLGALAQKALDRAAEPPGRVATRHGCIDVAAAGLDRFVQAASDFVGGTSERPRRIGVMGGMGPAAAMQFSQYVVAFNDTARRDQDHVRMLVDQATDIPDRTGAILNNGPDPVPRMLASLRRLADAGADDIVMTCNTAHHFFPQIEAAIRRDHPGLGTIHIVDATMRLLDQQVPAAQRIGLLATSGTVETGVYQQRAPERTWKLPEPAMQARVMFGIYDGVKQGDLASGREHLLAAARKLAEEGVDAILLACTEIPLVLRTGDVTNARGETVPLIDTLEAQARAAIARAADAIPATPGLIRHVRQLLAQGAAAPADAAHA